MGYIILIKGTSLFTGKNMVTGPREEYFSVGEKRRCDVLRVAGVMGIGIETAQGLKKKFHFKAEESVGRGKLSTTHLLRV